MSAPKPRAAPRRARKRKPRGERTESALYDSSRLMGELVGRTGDFTARDAKGKRLGKFKTFETARAAIYAADAKAQAESPAQPKTNAPRPAPATVEKPARRRAGRVLELVG